MSQLPMRSVLAIVVIGLMYAAADACPPGVEPDWGPNAGFVAAPVDAVSWREAIPVPPRPSFYGRGGADVPVFRRHDGSIIPYSGPYPLGDGTRRIDLHVDEGTVLASRPGSEVADVYRIDPNVVPVTRSARLDIEWGAHWLLVDTDAVMLRVEQEGRAPQLRFDTMVVLFSKAHATVTALYADGREERIFNYVARGNWAPPRQPVKSIKLNKPREMPRWSYAVLLALAALCCVAIGRRLIALRASARDGSSSV